MWGPTVGARNESDLAVKQEPGDRAAEYRKLAAQCLEVAERMSLRADRERMMDMATRWLEMARKAEAACADD